MFPLLRYYGIPPSLPIKVSNIHTNDTQNRAIVMDRILFSLAIIHLTVINDTQPTVDIIQAPNNAPIIMAIILN